MEKEEKRVNKELANIRKNFGGSKLSGYDRKKYVPCPRLLLPFRSTAKVPHTLCSFSASSGHHAHSLASGRPTGTDAALTRC